MPIQELEDNTREKKFSLSIMVTQRLKSVSEVCWQVPVPTEISHRLGKTPLYLLSKAKWNHTNQLQYIKKFG